MVNAAQFFDGLVTCVFLFFLHLAEQYLTLSQSFSHFLRHVNGNWHTKHCLTGKSAFLRMVDALQLLYK